MSIARRQHAPQHGLAAERRALEALAIAARERAPAALRARIELARDPQPRRRLGHPLAVVGSTTALAAAGLSALIALLIGGGPTAPTVAATAALGWRSQAVALHAPPGTPPAVSAAGIAFPDWSPQFGLRVQGIRADRVGGRLATTVFYGSGHQRIAYTIVSGAPLQAGVTTQRSVWQGRPLQILSADGRVTVSWVQGGHSCVLSAPGASPGMLARLASSEASSSAYG